MAGAGTPFSGACAMRRASPWFLSRGSWASPVGSTRAWASSLTVGGYDEGWLQRRRAAASRRKSRPARGGRAVGAEAGGAGGSVRRQEGGSLG